VNHYKACIFMIWVVCCRYLVTTVVGDATSKAHHWALWFTDAICLYL
jgi:hypothetical protein